MLYNINCGIVLILGAVLDCSLKRFYYTKCTQNLTSEKLNPNSLKKLCQIVQLAK